MWEEYRMTSPLTRTLFSPEQQEQLDKGEPTSADGEVVNLPIGILVRCIGMDGLNRALLEIVGPPESPYIGKRFPSSTRTQRCFELNI